MVWKYIILYETNFMEEFMVKKMNWLGIWAMVLIFGMMVIGCNDDSGSGSGSLDGTTWISVEFSGYNLTLKFSGSNYTLSGDKSSSGTYTLASDGKDLKFTQTSPSSGSYKGYYHSKDNLLTADFTGNNVDFKKN